MYLPHVLPSYICRFPAYPQSRYWQYPLISRNHPLILGISVSLTNIRAAPGENVITGNEATERCMGSEDIIYTNTRAESYSRGS